MKIADGMELIKTGWVQKTGGFRVKFQEQTKTGLKAGYSPPVEASPLTSDVTAGRPPGRTHREPFSILP